MALNYETEKVEGAKNKPSKPTKDVGPSCPFCHNKPEENYEVNSDIAFALAKIMRRDDSEEERFSAIDDALKADCDLNQRLKESAVGEYAVSSYPTMASWLCARDRHIVEQAVINYPKQNPVVLEVGVAAGGTSNTLMVARLDSSFIGIDDWSADVRYKSDFAENTRQFKSRVEMIEGDSRTVAKTWSRKLDVLLVDGGHEYDVAKSDLANFVPWIKNGGVIMIDDYYDACQPVKKATDEELTGHPNFEVLRMPDPLFQFAEKLIVFRRKTGERR